ARQGHVELFGEFRDRSIGPAELLEHAPSGGVRERGEGGIEAGLHILNHSVQCTRATCDAQAASTTLSGRPTSVVLSTREGWATCPPASAVGKRILLSIELKFSK